MNERIDKLAEQAGASVHREQTRSGDWVDFSDYTGFDYTKFAELIVRECMTIGFNTVYKVDDDSAAVAVYQNIKQHFGVQE